MKCRPFRGTYRQSTASWTTIHTIEELWEWVSHWEPEDVRVEPCLEADRYNGYESHVVQVLKEGTWFPVALADSSGFNLKKKSISSKNAEL